MSDVTELRCWPCCSEAIAWSADGIIALASEDRVELLFPSSELFEKEDDVTSFWAHISLPVPWFTDRELPVRETAPVSTYSVGEEISTNITKSIAWSPSGLASHRRCALGVLTSNLILSIWASDGKPQDETSWGRQLMVNNALAEYFSGGTIREGSHLHSEPAEKLRLRSRIRAFAWAPALPNPGDSSIVGTQLIWGQHVIAVANDDNSVAILSIESPTSTLGVGTWRARILSHFSVMPSPEHVLTDPACFDDLMQQQRHVSRLAWSPWVIRGTWYISVLVYATQFDVRARSVSYTNDQVIFGDEVIYLDPLLCSAGPLVWSQRVAAYEQFTLALFTRGEVLCLSISTEDARILRRTSYHLDGRWDEISGAVWEDRNGAPLRLHFCSVSSTVTSPTALLQLSDSCLTPLPGPIWREYIRDTQVLFNAQHELNGKTRAKVFGLCLSPLGDFVASCHTLHPSDMMEYGQQSDRRTSIAINGLQSYSQGHITFPSGNVTSEAILLTVKKWFHNTVEDAKETPEFARKVLDELMRIYGPPQGLPNGDGQFDASIDPEDLRSLIYEFRKEVFLNTYTLADRYRILLSKICTPSQTIELEATSIAFRLASAIETLPTSRLQASQFSSQVAMRHRQVANLIRTLLYTPPTHSVQEPRSTHTDFGAETCDFCGALIPFSNLKTATCGHGHQFPRCGLSFIAIQQPGITKYCGICNTPFLTDEYVVAHEMVNGAVGASRSALVRAGCERQEDGAFPDGDVVEETAQVHSRAKLDNEDGNRDYPVTLARLLFLACDVCIYCGAKFIGEKSKIVLRPA